MGYKDDEVPFRNTQTTMGRSGMKNEGSTKCCHTHLQATLTPCNRVTFVPPQCQRRGCLARIVVKLVFGGKNKILYLLSRLTTVYGCARVCCVRDVKMYRQYRTCPTGWTMGQKETLQRKTLEHSQ